VEKGSVSSGKPIKREESRKISGGVKVRFKFSKQYVLGDREGK